MKENYEPSSSNESASLASHSCTDGNSTEQVEHPFMKWFNGEPVMVPKEREWFTSEEVKAKIRATIAETAAACIEWIEKETLIVDENKNPLPNAVIDLDTVNRSPLKLTQYIYPRLEKYGIKLSSEQEVKASDTTDEK